MKKLGQLNISQFKKSSFVINQFKRWTVQINKRYNINFRPNRLQLLFHSQLMSCKLSSFPNIAPCNFLINFNNFQISTAVIFQICKEDSFHLLIDNTYIQLLVKLEIRQIRKI